VDADFGKAEQVMSDLAAAGVNMESVTDKLLTEGLASFQKSFDSLIGGLDKKKAELGKK
jgi:transaldolase